MTKVQILAIMAAMTAATHTFAQQMFHLELEPYTAKRRVVPISGGPVTAYLRLTPEDPWSIRESGITAPDDDWLWSGPYGSFPGTPPLPSGHTYVLLNGVSSRQYVQIYGHLYRPGPGEGVSPWFRATVPSVDIDWEGFETKAHEESEHDNTVPCLATSDITLCRKMIIRPPRDDTSLVWPSQTLSWQPAAGLRILDAAGSPVANGGEVYVAFGQTLTLYAAPLETAAGDTFIITLTGSGDGDFQPTDKITGIVIKIDMITPAGDPINSPVQSGDGQNEFTYSTASPGVLTMNLKAHVTPSDVADKIKDQVRFTVDGIGASTMVWATANPGGKPTASGDDLLATVTFTGLPANNSEFGAKKAAVYFSGNKQDEESYEVFFNRDAQNNPTSSDRNWYHYWTKALGCVGQHTYNDTLPTSQTVVSSATSWTIQIGSNANWPSGNPPTGGKYINGFWASNLHEFWHRDHRVHNFSVHGKWVPSFDDDIDGDGICDREPGDPPGHTGGWEAIIGTDPSVPNSTEDGGNWAEQQGAYGHDSKDWSDVGSQSEP